MRLTISVTTKEKSVYKTADELINAVCGTLDANMFEVYYLDHKLDEDEIELK